MRIYCRHAWRNGFVELYALLIARGCYRGNHKTAYWRSQEERSDADQRTDRSYDNAAWNSRNQRPADEACGDHCLWVIEGSQLISPRPPRVHHLVVAQVLTMRGKVGSKPQCFEVHGLALSAFSLGSVVGSGVFCCGLIPAISRRVRGMLMSRNERRIIKKTHTPPIELATTTLAIPIDQLPASLDIPAASNASSPSQVPTANTISTQHIANRKSAELRAR